MREETVNMTVRVRPQMRRQLRARAKLKDMSLNGYLVHFLEQLINAQPTGYTKPTGPDGSVTRGR